MSPCLFKSSWLLMLAGLLSACSYRSVRISEDSLIRVDKDGAFLFSVRIPSGAWYLPPSSKSTMHYNFVTVDGSFPTGPKIPHSVRLELWPLESSPVDLAEILPVLKSASFDSYLGRYLGRYSPTRNEERRISRFGGRVIEFSGLQCVNPWHATSVAPDINGGEGIPLVFNMVFCPVIIDGAVYLFRVDVMTYLGAWYYHVQKDYAAQRKPEDPPQAPTLDELLGPGGVSRYLEDIAPTVAELFSGIQFFGAVSQNYADIVHPELLEEKARQAPPR